MNVSSRLATAYQTILTRGGTPIRLQYFTISVGSVYSDDASLVLSGIDTSFKGYWKFDGSPIQDTIQGDVGSIISGLNNGLPADLSFVNGPYPNITGSAIQTPGSPTYLRFSSNVNRDYISGAGSYGPFTLAYWIYPPSDGTTGSITYGQISGQVAFGFRFGASGATATNIVPVIGPSAVQYSTIAFSGNTPYNLDSWNRTVWSFEGSPGSFYLYLNGSQIGARNSYPTMSGLNTLTPHTLFRNVQFAGNNSLSGTRIDDLIWVIGSAWNLDAVKSDFNNGSGTLYSPVSGADVWTSGVIFPLSNQPGHSDSILLEQGKLINGDSRLFVHGSLVMTGSEMQVKITVGNKEYIIGKEYEFSDMLQEDKNFEVKWRKGILSGYCPHPNSSNSFVCGNQYYVHCREKVEELDYEILTVNPSEENKNNTNKEAVTTWEICNKDLKYWNIHSVKRLSDGEVFTIGDRVHQVLPLKDDNTWLIKEFSTKDTRCFTIGVNITCIEKSKTPLFTTEDGVDIFKGNEYWYVVTFDHHIGHEWKPLNHVADWNGNAELMKPPLGGKQFSTKEEAEKWVLFNKPCLSINDLIYSKNAPKGYATNTIMESFKELVKSKL